MSLYTKQGWPLQLFGDVVYSRSGKVVGRIQSNKVYGKDGRYVATIDGDRLVHRSMDGAIRAGIFSANNIPGSPLAKAMASAIYGNEPNIPE
jgi:hypothetical protein